MDRNRIGHTQRDLTAPDAVKLFQPPIRAVQQHRLCKCQELHTGKASITEADDNTPGTVHESAVLVQIHDQHHLGADSELQLGIVGSIGVQALQCHQHIRIVGRDHHRRGGCCGPTTDDSGVHCHGLGFIGATFGGERLHVASIHLIHFDVTREEQGRADLILLPGQSQAALQCADGGGCQQPQSGFIQDLLKDGIGLAEDRSQIDSFVNQLRPEDHLKDELGAAANVPRHRRELTEVTGEDDLEAAESLFGAAADATGDAVQFL